MTTRTPRARTLVVTLAAALLAVLGAYRWAARDESLIAAPPRAAWLPSTTPAREGVPVGAAHQPAAGASPRAGDPGATTAAPHANASPQTRLTPGVFDLATLGRATEREQREQNDTERFPTNDWFTQEDQRHPERYFELAERMPELNRPEERRDTLEYFRAYRDTLQRDLDAAGDDGHERQETLATIARYDHAIARLGRLIETERPADARRPERRMRRR